MRKYYYFIRHGECMSNVDTNFAGAEDPLTEKGASEATLVAKRFGHAAIDSIYHSGITRAAQTAAEIEKVTGVRSQVKVCLKERRGKFTDGAYGYAEGYSELHARLIETKTFLESLSTKHNVLVGHAAFFKALVAYCMLGDGLTESLLQSFDESLVMDNCGISKCMFNEEKGKWRIMFWNDVSHLQS